MQFNHWTRWRQSALTCIYIHILNICMLLLSLLFFGILFSSFYFFYFLFYFLHGEIHPDSIVLHCTMTIKELFHFFAFPTVQQRLTPWNKQSEFPLSPAEYWLISASGCVWEKNSSAVGTQAVTVTVRYSEWFKPCTVICRFSQTSGRISIWPELYLS